MTPVRVLLVEDDRHIREIVQFRLEKKGYQVHNASTGGEAMTAIQENEFDVVLLDIGLPEHDGLEVLEATRKASQLTQVIMVTAAAKVDSVTKAMRLGALDYITKPIDFVALDRAFGNALQKIEGYRQNLAVQRLVEARMKFPAIVAESKAMKSVLALVEKAASSNAPVLVLGESGTGKELIARTIHLKGPRAQASFLPINCAGLQETLLESELFGYEKGAFTGAAEMRRGLFEAAHQGTLFMDEIGEMSTSTQASLLRVLESGEIRRIGGRSTLFVDVRIVAATNRDLAKAVQEGRFRQDLYYRLNTVVVTLPPLRERREDIWPLAGHFLEVLSQETGKPRSFSEETRPLLERHSWPGNVRELRNLVERLVLLSEGDVIQSSDLPSDFGQSDPVGGTRFLSLAGAEKRQILKVLEHAGGNRHEAARMLKISRATLQRKLKEYGFTRSSE